MTDAADGVRNASSGIGQSSEMATNIAAEMAVVGQVSSQVNQAMTGVSRQAQQLSYLKAEVEAMVRRFRLSASEAS